MERAMSRQPILAYSRPEPVAASNHRIANSLAVLAGLVRLQAASVGDRTRPFDGEELRTILAELGSRVDAVARLHRRLAAGQADAAIDLGEYLQEISAAAVAALPCSRGIQLQFDCHRDCMLPPERALSIGFTVVELVTNAVKYAHPTGVPGHISVACSRGPDGAVTVKVSDDGIGLPEGLDPMTANSLGLRMVRSLAAQLGARLRFEHDALGLSCVLQMPEGRA
jgi:two-component sensor histidine kinase